MTTLIESLLPIFERDLDKLAEEIKLYPTENALWVISDTIKNPGGNLCLHLCGNLQHYIGAVLGKMDYQRNRDAEFADKNVPREKLISEISKAKTALTNVLPGLTEAQLAAVYPQDVLGKPMTTQFFLLHLSAHLSYHLGQVNYHRRLLKS